MSLDSARLAGLQGSALRHRLLAMLPWILLCLSIASVQWFLHGWLYAASDDPYIYLGYVKQALADPPSLFSYNPGEHSGGTTGLLYYYLLIVVCGALHALLFFVPLPEVLLLGLWLQNTVLFLLAGAWYLKAATRLGVGAAAQGPAIVVGLFLLFCANSRFLWGAFSGLENPLSALLVLILVERLLARAPAWQPALAAAGLVGTRPETASVLWVAPLAAAFVATPAARRSSASLAKALAAFGAALALLFVPCRLATGQWLPSSLGARVQLAPLLGAVDSSSALGRALQDQVYWSSEWLLYAYASIALAAFVVRRLRGALLGMALVLLGFYVVRARLGLHDFNVEDRYVSYLWPFHALVFAAASSALASRVTAHALRRFSASVAAVALCGLGLFSIADFFVRFERHVKLMDEAVVRPSRWMKANLPASSRICMEPAGAIRVFTDFYLVDAVGLTTDHRRGYGGDYVQFVLRNRVDYVFDRDEAAGLLVQRGTGRKLVTWAPGQPWGDLNLYEVGPPRNAAIVQLTSSSSIAPGAEQAAFDNVATAASGRGDAWIAALAPAWIEVSLASPVPIYRVDVVVSTASDASASSLRVQGSRRGAPIELHARNAARAPLAAGLRIWSFAPRTARDIDRIRIEITGATPIGIVEVTAVRHDTPFWWLDLR